MITVSLDVLGDRLKKARKRSGLTLNQVGDFLGVSSAYISMIESGIRELSSLRLASLAELYGQSPLSFIDEESEFDEVQSCAVAFRMNRQLSNEDLKCIALVRRIADDFKLFQKLAGVQSDV